MPFLRRNSLLSLLPWAVSVAVLASVGTSATTYDVSPSDDGMGLSEALELAEPGDTIFLADGTYDTAIVSYRDGKEGQPITIQGGNDVVIKGNYRSRSVLINHSFISLKVSRLTQFTVYLWPIIQNKRLMPFAVYIQNDRVAPSRLGYSMTTVQIDVTNFSPLSLSSVVTISSKLGHR